MKKNVQPIGSRCDFENEDTLCPKWNILTMADKMVDGHLLTRMNGNITTIVSKDESFGTTQLGPIHEARPGSARIGHHEESHKVIFKLPSTICTHIFFLEILSSPTVPKRTVVAKDRNSTVEFKLDIDQFYVMWHYRTFSSVFANNSNIFFKFFLKEFITNNIDLN
uniref:Uncharacterized protein n=1 Tax=Heterorhabditis bacteriophora TaxID=37862 RepID=A0A1I7W8Q6_HETBA